MPKPPSLHFAGGALSEARRQTLARLIHRLRRHFPRGAAAEIWDEFKTALRDVQRVDGFEVNVLGEREGGGWEGERARLR